MPGGYSTSRPHGQAEWAGGGTTIVRDCVQCCHCGSQFFVCPGSGKKRGWCIPCGQVTCGRPGCEEHMHWKKKIELVDRGAVARAILRGGRIPSVPVTVSVEGLPPGSKVSQGGVILGKG